MRVWFRLRCGGPKTRKWIAAAIAGSMLLVWSGAAFAGDPEEDLSNLAQQEFCANHPTSSICGGQSQPESPNEVVISRPWFQWAEDVTIVSTGGLGGRKEVTVTPIIVQDRLLVPVRPLGRMLEAQVDWDPRSRMVTITKTPLNGVTYVVRMFPASDDPALVTAGFLVGEQLRYRLDAAPIIIDGTTYLPFRFLAEAMNAYVEWDGTTRTVRVDLSRPAEPTLSQFRIQAQNLVPNFRLNAVGDFELFEPDSGFEAYPSVVAHFRQTTAQMNNFIRETRKDPAHFRLIPEDSRVRVVDAKGQPVMDLYGTHVIVWMTPRVAQDFISRQETQGSGGGLFVVLGTTLISLWFKGEAVVVKAVLSGLAVAAGWYGVKQLTAHGVERCLASSDTYYRTHPGDQRIGIVHGSWSGACVDHYTAELLTLRHPIITGEAFIGDD